MPPSPPPEAILPYRGRFGDPRPEGLRSLALPPGSMPSHGGLRPLKAWRYVGVFGSEVMLCAAAVRIGRARSAFWAVWDRRARRLHERSVLGRGRVELSPGRVRVREADVQFELELEEGAGVESVCQSAGSYAWTRKQGGVSARGVLVINGRPHPLQASAIIDDTAAYYARHTCWRWCAGVGTARDGRAVAWNLVSGVNDPAAASERTVWVEGQPSEAPPVPFSAGLGGVEGLRFEAEAMLERHQNLLLVRSSYRQPFGTFSGRLPGNVELESGYGVMEEHDAWW